MIRQIDLSLFFHCTHGKARSGTKATQQVLTLREATKDSRRRMSVGHVPHAWALNQYLASATGGRIETLENGQTPPIFKYQHMSPQCTFPHLPRSLLLTSRTNHVQLTNCHYPRFIIPTVYCARVQGNHSPRRIDSFESIDDNTKQDEATILRSHKAHVHNHKARGVVH